MMQINISGHKFQC